MLSKIFDGLPAFMCANAVGNLWSICLGFNTFIPFPNFLVYIMSHLNHLNCYFKMCYWLYLNYLILEKYLNCSDCSGCSDCSEYLSVSNENIQCSNALKAVSLLLRSATAVCFFVFFVFFFFSHAAIWWSCLSYKSSNIFLLITPAFFII